MGFDLPPHLIAMLPSYHPKKISLNLPLVNIMLCAAGTDKSTRGRYDITDDHGSSLQLSCDLHEIWHAKSEASGEDP